MAKDDLSGSVELHTTYGNVKLKEIVLEFYMLRSSYECFYNEKKLGLKEPLCAKLAKLMKKYARDYRENGKYSAPFHAESLHLEYEHGKCVSAHKRDDVTYGYDDGAVFDTKIVDQKVIDEGYQLLKLVAEKYVEEEKKS